jgi:hypothetical protein
VEQLDRTRRRTDPGAPTVVIVVGPFVFGIIFAANSAVHPYLILAYSENDRATMNVGFHYMANAGWRLIGTVLSGLLYELGGLESRPADTLARRLTKMSGEPYRLRWPR